MTYRQAVPWSSDEEQCLIELWNAGHSYGAIWSEMQRRFAKRYNRNIIAGKRKRLGLAPRETRVAVDRLPDPAGYEPRPTKPPKPAPKNPRPKRTERERRELIDGILEMREAGKHIWQIENHYGVSRNFIRYHCAINGVFGGRPPLARVTLPPTSGRWRHVTVDEEKRMVELREQGYGVPQIAKMVGRPYSTVKYRLYVRAALDDLSDG